jgi:hypothetical protein
MKTENASDEKKVNVILANVNVMLPDGVLWKKSTEYAQQFAIIDKPVASEKRMSEAQEHFYSGMIAARKMLLDNQL